MKKIGIIGAGAWGTALATQAIRAGNDVIIWAREPEVVKTINNDSVNDIFLPGFKLDRRLRATNILSEAVSCDMVFIVVPSQHFREICNQIRAFWVDRTPAIICSKGIERKTNSLLTQVLLEEIPKASPMILSGPTFAIEVARGMPTAVTLACEDMKLGMIVSKSIATNTFRPYLSNDLAGVAVGGAVKNVLAIACGLTEGLEMGNNARASLITRGLAEVIRLSLALGGKERTLNGLSGLGDLLLTATSFQSRNYSLGVALGQGMKLQQILSNRVSVAEGVYSSSALVSLANSKNIDMPICFEIDQVINHMKPIEIAIKDILERPIRSELD